MELSRITNREDEEERVVMKKMIKKRGRRKEGSGKDNEEKKDFRRCLVTEHLRFNLCPGNQPTVLLTLNHLVNVQ